MGYLTNPLKLLGLQPLPSHPYDRAKAHNKRVAIMRCPILSVEWHFPPQSSGSLTITQQIMQRLHSGETDGSAARSLRQRRHCKRRREWRRAQPPRARAIPWRWVGYSAVPMRPCRFRTAPLAQSALSPHDTNQRARNCFHVLRAALALTSTPCMKH